MSTILADETLLDEKPFTRFFLCFGQALLDVESIAMVNLSEVSVAIDNGTCHLPHVNKNDHNDRFIVSIHYSGLSGHAVLQTLLKHHHEAMILMEDIQAKINNYWKSKHKKTHQCFKPL